MIVVWALITAAWSSLATSLDLGSWLLPDIAIVISIWAGLRVWRYDEDLLLALVVGLVSGLFTTDPWFMSPFLSLLAVQLSSFLRVHVAPRSLVGRSLAIGGGLLLLGIAEALLRLSVPSLILDGNTSFGIVCRTLTSIPLTICLDQVRIRR